VDSLAAGADRCWLQGVGAGRIGFSRCITTAGPAAMRAYSREGGRARWPFAVDHDGIEDAFVEKASVVYFRHAGKWKELPGAD